MAALAMQPKAVTKLFDAVYGLHFRCVVLHPLSTYKRAASIHTPRWNMQQQQRLFRPQRIYYPDRNKYLKLWIGEHPGLTRDRVVFRDPSGHAGVPMFLLLDKSQSELEGILEDPGEVMKNFTYNGEITLIASWSEYYPRKAWTNAIELGEECITRGELAIRAAELFKKIVDDLKEEQRDDPYVAKDDDLSLRYPVSFDQLVLISMDKISDEEGEEQAQDWWQVMIAVDIMTNGRG